ncbi:MAG: glycosyltransferase family 2 protein [Bacteroidia bacterium]|nr:glycosyltransferase family 2 protein [Bacteroidia bacterium]
MFVSGFTIARNVLNADYPVKEAIYSILPLCDEIIVAVGKSEDDTLNYIKSFNEPKIKIIETVWDDNLREGGRVLAAETDKAFKAIDDRANWCIYIQADEVLDDRNIDNLKSQMLKYQNDNKVEGLLFDYTHFYGSYNYVADSRSWYRKEIRIVKNLPGIHSWKDAQGFRIDGRKLNVKPAMASIFHYGWVKDPELQLKKLKQARKMWHTDEFLLNEYGDELLFDYNNVDSLKLYSGEHPEVMKPRIKAQNWSFNFDTRKKNLNLKKRLLWFFEKLTGYRLGENKNYKVL